MHFILMMLKRRIRHGTHFPRICLRQFGMLGRQRSAHGAHDGARGLGNAVVRVHLLESWAELRVHGFVLVVWDGGGGGMGVDDCVVVGHLDVMLFVGLSSK